MKTSRISEVQTVQPRGPYFVKGYSFGRLICSEMAWQLHRLSHSIGLVALIDTGQPIFRKDWANILFSPETLGNCGPECQVDADAAKTCEYKGA